MKIHFNLPLVLVFFFIKLVVPQNLRLLIRLPFSTNLAIIITTTKNLAGMFSLPLHVGGREMLIERAAA